MKRLYIVGASGHGKVVANIAKLNGYEEILFLDDDESIAFCDKYPVVGNTQQNVSGDLFIAIGNASIRARLSKNKDLVTLIHPNAVIAEGVEIGAGSVVMAGAIINPGVRIGNGVIVNTSSSIDHDCIVGDYAHISVGAHLCGTVNVGKNTWIGAGATISNNISICDDCIIGAGAVVINDIKEKGVYFGVPAKMKSNIGSNK